MYNPSLHTATNKPIGLTGKPIDARSYYYDESTFTYRPYASIAEVLAYLIGGDRSGQFGVIIARTEGGYDEWWFRNGIADSDLIIRGTAQWGDIGGDITNQTDLVSYIDDIFLRIDVSIPAGSPYPFNYPLSDPYNTNVVSFVPKQKISSTKYRLVNDVYFEANYQSATLDFISSIDIYGHTVNGTTTVDDLRIDIFIKRSEMATQVKIFRVVQTFAKMVGMIQSEASDTVVDYTVISDEENNDDNLSNYTYYNGVLNQVAIQPVDF